MTKANLLIISGFLIQSSWASGERRSRSSARTVPLRKIDVWLFSYGSQFSSVKVRSVGVGGVDKREGRG
ncbi:hypothetical protein M758_UG184300 [Ceratodon purpureus]|nr:hypothetical protein M758_UG184300 [Ceratodon purpureus]